MSGKRLLQRVAEWQTGKKSAEDSFDLPDSIARDIELLLNSQRGNVLIDENMGLPDLRSFFQSHSAVDTEYLTQEISQQIKSYEKRVDITNLTFDDKKNDPTQLSWQLNASVAGGMNQEVNAKIHIGMDGRVRVEPAV
ncbi:MAG: type VI secretion system baseplate subunit TssE [Oceanospirillaceae bacterium]|uniref:type VI secretion system baseplate subunit TssE n=1 Tax=unclassified Thalassolituus TaxID=2624967 RepID=UPI000C407633|nr:MULTISPECIES: type VI secretion system baseplate subunit TssE [unclassified Thalassolituus]MAS24014.1 type VI secretion system baseplate subunit TssE [Oceanospirillaceae bacterium]MAY01240.1 type VI secretion system baseplate subunit TssE [Oceanospirillaceae bacterium]MBL36389.1 type VI secretion system baseplate subunit TssE [Oceanospirillaceae bacterium]MBS52536.1 type VI secretion system baseplate subunit TssE [Oceanospirillaceae bacterium]|tara:strand:+ start:22 stop:435 length:414 start_codon:yes stop_codon:yes gene_type:complete